MVVNENMGIKEAIQSMTTGQKIATVIIAILVPLGAWFGLGFPTSSAAIGALASAETVAVIGSIATIYGVAPPTAKKP